jgi:Flp pilus assembly protein TadG
VVSVGAADRAGQDRAGERGSTLPFVLVSWLIAALMTFGAIAASDAFLKQQEVQSVCDGAALAGAGRADESAVYRGGVGSSLPGRCRAGGRGPAVRRRVPP